MSIKSCSCLFHDCLNIFKIQKCGRFFSFLGDFIINLDARKVFLKIFPASTDHIKHYIKTGIDLTIQFQNGILKYRLLWVFSAQLSALIFGTVSPLSMFSIIQPLFLQKTLSLYTHIPNIYLGLGFEFGPQRIRELSFVCP